MKCKKDAFRRGLLRTKKGNIKRVIAPVLAAAMVLSQMNVMPTVEAKSAATDVDETVTISPYNASSFNDGEFEGWGTSFCWWANRIGYSDSLAEQAAEAFYDKEQGLGLNIIRYNIGGGDDPTHTHITRTDSNMPGYATNPTYNAETGEYTWDYDWTADANQRNVLLKAMEACGDEVIVEAFSNSPPYFMTNSGCSTGATDASKNNLKDDAYEEFAQYLADVSEHFSDEWDVDFQSITPMNEPYTSYWGAYSNKQEGCHFDQGESQSNIIVDLRKALDEKGFDNMQISGTDETSIDTQITSYNELSSEAKNAITRIDTHTYGGSKRSSLKALAEAENKNLWMSEVDGGGTDGTDADQMGSGLWLANRIITDMNGMTPSAWILWQVIDNHISAEGYNGNQDTGMVDTSAGFWGTAVADHDNDDIILTMKYYAFGQFSRYIRPGYTIISGTNNTLAAYDADGKQLVIVATNTSDEDKAYDFDLSQFSAVGDNVKVIRTSGTVEDGEKWKELAPVSTYGTGFNATLKANSVTTYIVEDVENNGVEMHEISVNTDKVTGSAPWGNSSSTADLVFDGDTSTYFDGVNDGYVIADLENFYQLNAISFAPRSGYAYRCVDASFYGSVDGENWVPIYTISTTPSNDYNYVFSKKFDNNMAFRYIKYAVPSGSVKNDVNTDGSYNCNIAEIKLFGEEASMLQALQGLYAANKNITQGHYTEESYAVFTKALQDAKVLIDEQSGDDEKIQKAIEAIAKAYAGLTLSDDTPKTVVGTIANVVTYAGSIPDLTKKVLVNTVGGEQIEANIDWDYEAEDFETPFETVNVEGVIEDTDIAVEAKVEVIPKNLVYYIDCGTLSSGSDVYDQVADKTASLLNDKSDQEFDGTNGWGVSGTYHEYSGSSDTNKFLTGYYADNKSTEPILYTLPLTAGTYDITIQNHEWWSGPRTMNIEASWEDVDGETTTQVIAENVKVSSGRQNAMNTGTITVGKDTTVTISVYLSAGTEAPTITFLGVAKSGEVEEPVAVEPGHAVLVAPAQISNKAGTVAKVQMRAGSMETPLKMVEAVVNVDKAFVVDDVTANENFVGGELNWNVEEQENTNVLRLVYADFSDDTELTTTENMPFDMFHISLSLKEDVEDGTVMKLSMTELGQYTSSEAKVDYVTEVQEQVVEAVGKEQGDVVATVLYEGDGSDLIPDGTKAVKVVFTGLENVGKIAFVKEGTSYPLFHSVDFTKRDSADTYLMTVDVEVTEEELNNIESYQITEEDDMKDILFGDTNADEEIDAQDALQEVRTWLRKDTVEMTSDNILTYNVTGDEAINSADALAIVEYFVSGKTWKVLANH